MKKRMIILTALAVGCGFGAWAQNTLDRASRSSTNEVRKMEADNTGVNVRDREPASLTPGSQGNSEADLSMTRRIRQAIMDSKDLSMNAKNIKVITSNGRVTLKGPVKTDEEKQTLSSIAEQIAQKANVDNQIEVANDKDTETRKD